MNARYAIVIGGLVLATTVSAVEKIIARAALPPAVEKTIAEISKGATIRSFHQEEEKGRTTYEVEMVVNGHHKDVQMDGGGAILEVEEQVALDSLSEEVKRGLQAKAGKGRIKNVESLTKRDKLVAYEAQIVTGGKSSEIQVGPDGKALGHKE